MLTKLTSKSAGKNTVPPTHIEKSTTLQNFVLPKLSLF